MAEEVEEEAVVDSWEDFEENPEVLDQHLKKLSVKNEKPHEKVGDTFILSDEEIQRSFPFNSQEPKIMILQRPQKSIELPNGIISQKQKQPVKTLEQRQAEYAEARLRILGNPGSPSEEIKIKPLQHKPNEQNSYESSVILEENPSNVSLPDNSNQSSLCFSSGTSKPIAFIKASPSAVSVIRTPRGPSSQLGFQHRSETSHSS